MEPKQALSHPKRRKILDYLTERGETGETELFEVLSLTTARVRYHLRVMQDAGLVVQVERSEQGELERFYATAESTDT